MAALSALVRIIAEVQGLEENQVLWIARYLREGGLISQGGRGRGGAQMNLSDAANLLIGVNAPGVAKNSSQLVREFRELKLIRDYLSPEDTSEWDDLRSANDDEFTKAFYRGAPFGKAMETIIAQYVDCSAIEGGDISRITLSGPDYTASVYMGADDPEGAGDMTINVLFGQKNLSDDQLLQMPDQEISMTFTQRTLSAVGRLLAT